jgi:RimJ/RimL family protein N-acetyltransferase
MPEFELRRARAEDAEAILAIREHPITRQYQPLVPGTLETWRRMLAERGSAPLTPRQAGKVQWSVVVGGGPVGWVTIDVTSRDHHSGTLGYSIHPDYHGKGLATAAVRAALPLALAPGGLALERLEAVAAVENIASRRVLEKSGFTFEGIARGYLILSGVRVDHARYARLSTDP